MTLAALLSAGFILGMAFNVYGLLALALVVVPIYFIECLHFGLLQATVWTLLSATAFEFGYFSGFMAQDRFLRRLASGPNPLSPRRGSWNMSGLNTFPRRQSISTTPPSLFKPLSQIYAKAARLLVVAARIWREPF